MNDTLSKKAYAVTYGEYSDYTVVAIFSTPEKRDAYLAQYQLLNGYAEAEDFDLDPDIPEVLEYIRVTMARDGTVIETERRNELVKLGGFENLYRDILVWCVQTTDVQRAVKVVNEKRAQIIAMNLWGDNTYAQIRAYFAMEDQATETIRANTEGLPDACYQTEALA